MWFHSPQRDIKSKAVIGLKDQGLHSIRTRQHQHRVRLRNDASSFSSTLTRLAPRPIPGNRKEPFGIFVPGIVGNVWFTNRLQPVPQNCGADPTIAFVVENNSRLRLSDLSTVVLLADDLLTGVLRGPSGRNFRVMD
jgi:hypothetical protein